MAVDGTNSISRLAAHHFDDIKASEKKPKEEPEKKVAENTDAATLDVSGAKEVKQAPETYKATEVKKPEQDIKSRGDPGTVSEKAQEYASVGNNAKTDTEVKTKSVESNDSDVKAVTKSIANADEAESSAQKIAASIKSEPSIAVMAQANQSANMVQQLLS